MPKSHILEGNRMLKVNMEPNHGGLVQIIFLSKWVICSLNVNLPGTWIERKLVNVGMKQQKTKVICRLNVHPFKL